MFLIIGGESEVGRAVADHLRAAGEAVGATTRRAGASASLSLDLAAIPDAWQPPAGTTAVCIAAAVARLADCAADPAGSARVNVTGTIALTQRLAGRGIYTLFLSTNQVFDGTRPLVPADAPPCPVSAYGRQKAMTEAALRQMMADGLPVGILRLSKVVSPGMALFAGWRQSLAAGRPVRAFTDMTLAPVPTAMVARAIGCMLRDRTARVAQLTGPRDISYCEAARHIAGLIGADPGLVEAGRAADIGLPDGATPAYTTLDSGFLHAALGMAVPAALEVVTAALARPVLPVGETAV